MEERELQFLIMIEAGIAIDQLMNELLFLFGGVNRVSNKSFDWGNNWCQLSENKIYQPQKIGNVEDDFLYYKYRLEVSPTKDVSLSEQVDVAKALRDKILLLTSVDGVEICADFEDYL